MCIVTRTLCLHAHDSLPTNRIHALLIRPAIAHTSNKKPVSPLQLLCGQELITYPLSLLASHAIPTTLITHPQEEPAIRGLLKRSFDTAAVQVIAQENHTPLNTACMAIDPTHDYVLVMSQALPFVSTELLEQLIIAHSKHNAALTLIPRTLRTHTHSTIAYTGLLHTLQKSVQHECSEYSTTTDTYSDMFLVNTVLLEQTLTNRTQTNAQESLLASIMQHARNTEQPMQILPESSDCMFCVSNMCDLHYATKLERAAILDYWMAHDVFFTDPDTVHIDYTVNIGAGTIIDGAVHLTGNTTIGSGCHLHSFSQLHDSCIGDQATIFSHCVLRNASVGAHTEIGPFAHLHATATVADHSAIGNFVEIQQSSVGAYTKARHLTYLGHAQVGNRVNIGAGTITCNYDGKNKNTTTIEDNTFIGSNNTLVAPITIEKGSFTAAGSVITTSVPKNTFAIGRARQINKIDCAQALRDKVQSKNKK